MTPSSQIRYDIANNTSPSSALLWESSAGKSWQLGFEWRHCYFCNLHDALAWCKQHKESLLAQRCQEWFLAERRHGNEFIRTGSDNDRFWRDVTEQHNPWPPLMDCTMFFMADEKALNLNALLSLQGTPTVPRVLRTDVARQCYIVEKFWGRPFPDTGIGVHPPDLANEAYDQMVARLLDGLKAIHGAGWTLGDIRPESIFVDVRAPPVYKEMWCEFSQDWCDLEFIEQDFDVYFVYFGRASDSKVGWEERVAYDQDCLKQVLGV